jgi:hypothetical protein
LHAADLSAVLSKKPKHAQSKLFTIIILRTASPTTSVTFTTVCWRKGNTRCRSYGTSDCPEMRVL